MKRAIDRFKKAVPQSLKNKFWHYPKALVANLKYGFPSKGMRFIGVTGTNGKTTTVNMIYEILKASGKKVSMISTINAIIAGKKYDTGFHVTSPNPFDLQRFISMAKKYKDEYLVLEVTSHALDQFRVLGIKFEVGVITNITHEHLDYHKNFDNYLKAKAKLIKNAKVAILNKDDENFSKLSKMTKGKIFSFGMHKTADFNPLKFPLKLRLAGGHNLMNALVATAATHSLGVSTKVIRQALESFKGLEGRFEEIESNLGFKIIIDFAHTPNALKEALITLKGQSKGKIIAVFGAAGDRDVSKRPLMGEVASKYADKIILTAEDPRYEDINEIIDEIAAGIKDTKNEKLFKIPDRKEAIKFALSVAEKGDIVSIFGKGHEQSMNYKGKELPWSDKKAVLEILNERKPKATS